MDTWEILDSQMNNDILNGVNRAHLFHVSKNKGKPFKYVRIIETGSNWYGNNHMIMNSIEFYGKII